jgi:hypothetical protein
LAVLWREKHQERELFGDVDEAMVDLFGDEDHGARLHGAALAGDLDCGAAGNDVIDLVFGVG